MFVLEQICRIAWGPVYKPVWEHSGKIGGEHFYILAWKQAGISVWELNDMILWELGYKLVWEHFGKIGGERLNILVLRQAGIVPWELIDKIVLGLYCKPCETKTKLIFL